MKKFLVLSSWSRFATIGSMLVVAFAVVGCDDSTSASTETNNDNVVIESSSSSSEKAKSSSSKEEKKAKESSSSVKPESTDKLSSSSKKMESSSSSSVIASSAKQSSSSGKAPASSEPVEGTSSSSSKKAKSSSSCSDETSVSSSSSADAYSSSSENAGESSSSSKDAESSSSSLVIPDGWSWNVPRELRLNPAITYDTMTDSRDNKKYKTVTIGKQVWMAENLNYYDATDLNVKEKSWCYGKKDNADSTTCDVAGRFYTWAAAIDSVKLATDAINPLDCGDGKTCALPDTVYGVCPPDWHLPSLEEWKILFEVVGGRSVAAGVLKSQSGWYSKGNGTDDIGFSAIPVGFRTRAGDYDFEGYFAHFWSASESDEDNAYDVFMNYYIKDVRYDDDVKFYGYSVRCVKNQL